METRKDFMDRALFNMGESWKEALKDEFMKPYFKELRKLLEEEYRGDTAIYPPAKHVFSWTHHCNPEDIKVVILGQDPYFGPDQANGLCFSVPKGVDQPPSLKNIFKELASDEYINGGWGFIIPDHGDLTKWAEKGVLLLNSVLTVRKGEPNSHKGKGWEEFTNAVIWCISSYLNNVVFMLWGNYAQEKGLLIDKNRHLILEASHPSPMSANQGYLRFAQPGNQPTQVQPFMGCHHFSTANQYLNRHGKTEINWNL